MAVIDLSVPLSSATAHHHTHRGFSLHDVTPHPAAAKDIGLSFALESFAMGTHVGTHMDAPSHVAVDGCFPNMVAADDLRREEGGYDWADALSLRPFVGRAHIVDATVLFGRTLGPSDAVTAEVFEEWFAHQVLPQPDEAVLIHTGWIEHFADASVYEGRTTGLPGIELSGAEWLTDHKVALAGADTLTFEHKPDPRQAAHSVHRHLLFDHGVPIIECMDLSELAARRVSQAQLAAAPLAIIGASGAPVRPLAMI